MKTRRFRKQLLSGVATSILGALALVSAQGQATASSLCTADTTTTPHTFNCIDDAVTSPATATGTFSAGATFAPGVSGRLEISSGGSLDVTLDGQINSTNVSNQYLTAAVYLTAAGPLSYTNNGTTTGSTTGWLFNTYLRADQSITANTGIVVADGFRVTGVFSETLNGDNRLIGGTTTVSGVWSRGLWSDAYYGNNVTDTGAVTATGVWSRGVIARATTLPYCETSTGQTATVNVTGDVSAEYIGISALACGTSIINVEAGRTVAVTGTDGMALLNLGATSGLMNIYGNVLAASIAGRALDTRSGSSATLIGSTGLMSGTFAGEEGVDTITLVAGGTWTSSGTSDFKAGNDAVNNNGSINAVAGIFANLETFINAGVLSLAGGSFAVTGSTDFTNNGTIHVSPGETTISIDSALFNDGTIDMQNGQAGDVLTIANDYVAGATAALMIDVSESASDIFVVNGTTTGTTQLFILAPASINTSAVLIATTDSPVGMLAIAANADQPGMKFVLGNQATRLIDFRLEQIGGNLYLAAVPNALAFQPILIGQVGRDMWFQSADIYSAYSALLRSDQATTRHRSVGLWGQAYASQDVYGDRATQPVFGADAEIDSRVQTDRSGAQIGVDFLLGRSMVAGLTGGYEKAKADHRSLDGGVDTDGYNVGAYGQFGRATGLYGRLLVKYDWSDAKLTNSAFDAASNNPDFHSVGGEAGVGYRWNSDSLRFDLGASISYVSTSIDAFSAEGIDYKFDPVESLRGSLDARAEFGRGKIVPFLNARLLHEFDGDTKLTLASDDEADKVEADGRNTWLRLEAGLGGKSSFGPILSGWADVGDVKGFGVRGGWRF